MSDSWLDHVPSHEREKIRKRMRSPEEYERLREKVKGPEDLEKEMEKNEAMAELSFALETEPAIRDALKAQVESDFKQEGIEAALDQQPKSVDAQKAVEKGKFKLSVRSHPQTHRDQLAIITDTKVQEALPLKTSFSDRYVSQWQQDGSRGGSRPAPTAKAA